MLSRSRVSLALAFVVLTLFLLASRLGGRESTVSIDGVALGSGVDKAIGGATKAQDGIDNVKDGGKPAVKDGSVKPLVINTETHQEEFEKDYKVMAAKKSAGAIYRATLDNLESNSQNMDLVRHPEYLTKTNLSMSYTSLHPRLYNPYPDRTSKKWQAASLAPFVECDSPWNGTGLTDDIKVFVGRPKDFPKPAFGSSGLLDIDSKLCFEREGRLGAYGYGMDNSTAGPYINWDSVNWGSLQDQCVKRNAARFHLNSKSEILDDTPPHDSGDPRDGWAPIPGETVPEKKAVPRTAILLRSFSGKVYTENDKQNIRSIINELGLRSGGEYEVFLLVQVKDPSIKLWTNNAVDNAAYEKAKRDLIPAEFQSIAHLWDDAVVQSWYPEIPKNVANVEKSQWLSVQRFANRHPSFDYFWNWEIDSRYTGHHYDLLTKIVDFARSQPRRGLWERNERFYIKDFHGPWLTKFRYTLADMYENNIVWGAPKVPDVTPVGPTPPPGAAKDEGYHWGVDEEADYISLAPIFNPENTGWNGSTDVWGYESGADSLPRRATIITQSRCSRRLLDLMHRENLLGKHIGSQMTPQTVALLHSLKAVYAPHPVFMDREWDGETLQKWFNSGPKGESGSGNESPFGWGREDRFRGSTWYFKAEAAIKLFNHWMGWEDGGIGGVEWEKANGRSCLPPMLLHPIKDVIETTKGYDSASKVP